MFSKINLQERIQSQDYQTFTRIKNLYYEFIVFLEAKFEENDKFSEDIDNHIEHVNEYISKTYLRSDKLNKECKDFGIDNKLNEKLTEIRLIDFENVLEIPMSMKGHSVWNKAIYELGNIQLKKTPKTKLETIVKCLSSISRAYLLLSDFCDEVTADDILQFTCYTILKSKLDNLYSSIRYIKAFKYQSKSNNHGLEAFGFQNLETACQYMLELDIENELDNFGGIPSKFCVLNTYSKLKEKAKYIYAWIHSNRKYDSKSLTLCFQY